MLTADEKKALEATIYEFVGKPIGPPFTSRDPVNEPMIRQWCDAMGDANAAYLDAGYAEKSVHGGIVAPPVMLDAWTMQGWEMHVGYDEPTNEEQRLHKILTDAGYTGVLGTDTEQEFDRYLKVGDVVTATTIIESISEEKATGAGIGYFITTKTTFTDQQGDQVGWMNFRVLKFIPKDAPQPAASSGGGQAEAYVPARIKPPMGHDNAWWWNEVAKGRIAIQRCKGCEELRHPPRPMCPNCRSMEWDSVEISGPRHPPHLHRDPLPAVPGLRIPDLRRTRRSRRRRADGLRRDGLQARRSRDRDEAPGLRPRGRRRLQAPALPAGGVTAMELDFSFSEEQEAIRELAREILEAEAPIERVKEAEKTSGWLDEALWKQCAEANLLGIAISEAHGGMGMGFGELCVLLEEVGRSCAPGPWLGTLVSAALPIAEFGSDAQRAAWLPEIAAGGAILTAALEDADSADFLAPATRANPADGGFALDGRKLAVPFAGTAAALLVPAMTPDGVGLFIVPADSPGVSAAGSETTTGEPLFEVTLHDVRVGADARLPADGAEVLAWIRPRFQTAVAILHVGVSDRALRITADYTTEREQFGVPVGSFQAVQHRQADAFIDLQAMRWTSWRAAWRLSEGLPAEREAMIAKWWTADGGARIANACVHMHGGLGADVDYPIHRYFYWSKALELVGGGASQTLSDLGLHMAEHGRTEEVG